VGDVGVHRHLIARQVVIDEEAMPLVERQFLHQGAADAHRHGADHLATGGLGVQDAPGCTHGEHAPDPDLAGRGVDTNFHEVGAEGGLLVLLVEVAVLDAVFGNQAIGARCLGERHHPLARAHHAVGELRVARGHAELPHHGLAQLHAGRIDAQRSRTNA
jgi:hypothetical protein